MGAPSARMYELSRFWVEEGHDVTVLTCFPNYPDGVIYDGYRDKAGKITHQEYMDGINVRRVWVYPTHLRSSVRRGLNYASSLISYTLSALFMDRFDIIITTSPPPMAGLTGIIIRFFKGTPFIFEVRDLWPEVIPAVGAGDKSGLSYKIIDAIVSLSYRKSDAVVALTNSFKNAIVHDRGIDENKITVIENAVDTERFKPEPDTGNTREDLGLENRFIVSYVGTIGLTHGVDIILGAAGILKDKLPDIVFLVVGDGYEKKKISELAESKGLKNIIMLNKQPRHKIPPILNASDICLVLSKNSELLKKTIFAKIFEPMACGRPLIVAAEGETREIIVKAGAGISISPQDSEALTQAIETLYADRSAREEMGSNARKYVTAHFSRRQKAHDYLKLIFGIIAT